MKHLQLNLTGCKVGDGAGQALAQRLPTSLNKLGLHFRGSVLGEQAVKAIAEHLPRSLTWLQLDLSNGGFGASAALSLAEHLPETLTELFLGFRGVSIGARGLAAVATHLPQHLKRVSLDFDHCFRNSDDYVDEVAMAAAAAAAVELLGRQLPAGLEAVKLGLGGVNLGRSSVVGLAARLPSDLAELVLDLSFGGLACEMESCATSFSGRRRVAASAAGAVVEHLPSKLEKLCLNFSCSPVRDRGAKAIAEHLPRGLKKLQLHLWSCKISDDGVQALAEWLPEHLTHLTLNLCAISFDLGDDSNDCTITDAGLKILANHLPSCLVQLGLDFSGCHVGDEGWQALVDRLPRGLKELRMCTGSYTGVTEGGMLQLVKSLPVELSELQLKLPSSLERVLEAVPKRLRQGVA